MPSLSRVFYGLALVTSICQGAVVTLSSSLGPIDMVVLDDIVSPAANFVVSDLQARQDYGNVTATFVPGPCCQTCSCFAAMAQRVLSDPTLRTMGCC